MDNLPHKVMTGAIKARRWGWGVQTVAQEPAHKLIIKETLTYLSALAVVGPAEQHESQSGRGTTSA